MAEWSCSGLQSRVRRFDSDPRLHFDVYRQELAVKVCEELARRASGGTGIHKALKMPRRKPCRFESGLAHYLDRFMPVRVRPRAPTRVNALSCLSPTRPLVRRKGRLGRPPIYRGSTTLSHRMLGAANLWHDLPDTLPGAGVLGYCRRSYGVWASRRV